MPGATGGGWRTACSDPPPGHSGVAALERGSVAHVLDGALATGFDALGTHRVRVRAEA